GTGGGAGNSGTGGTSGGGGTAGSGGNTSLATCTGCVEIAVPVNGGNTPANLADQAIFQFNLPAATDFSNAVITWKVMALENNDNFFVGTFAQNGPPLHPGYDGIYPGTAPARQNLTAAAFPPNVWTNVVLDVSAYRAAVNAADAGADAAPPVVVADAGDAGDAGGGSTELDPGLYDKSVTLFFGLQVGSNAAFTGTGTVHIAIDSVTLTGVPGVADKLFTTGVDGLGLNAYEAPPGTLAPVHHP
ncbi:MAG TPA: hypothetical protein VJU61_01610, partial [Polyangiaceae bacterium]|nr:hypothetical protein [Polyangiaceae bacterium]